MAKHKPSKARPAASTTAQRLRHAAEHTQGLMERFETETLRLGILKDFSILANLAPYVGEAITHLGDLGGRLSGIMAHLSVMGPDELRRSRDQVAATKEVLSTLLRLLDIFPSEPTGPTVAVEPECGRKQ